MDTIAEHRHCDRSSRKRQYNSVGVVHIGQREVFIISSVIHLTIVYQSRMHRPYAELSHILVAEDVTTHCSSQIHTRIGLA